MDELTRRERQLAESILENESLTADLSDEAAQTLLDWMIGCGKMVAQSIAGFDDQAAEQAMSPRLRAVRRLMRLVNKWIAAGLTVEVAANQTPLTEILEQAAIIYGQDFPDLDANRLEAFWLQGVHSVDNPQQLIVNLRAFVESFYNQTTLNTGADTS